MLSLIIIQILEIIFKLKTYILLGYNVQEKYMLVYN